MSRLLVDELRTDPWSGSRSHVADRGAPPAGLLAGAAGPASGAGAAPAAVPPRTTAAPPAEGASSAEAPSAAPATAAPPPVRARADLLHAVAAQESVAPVAVPDGLAAGDPAAAAALLEGWRAALGARTEAPFREARLEVGPDGGCRSSVVALPSVPARVARERERAGAHAVRTMGGVLGQELLQEEVKLRERVVAVRADAVVLAAWAPRAAGHLVLVPRAARARFEDDGPLGAEALAAALSGLRGLGATTLRGFVRTAPRGAEEGWCWRLELLPVLPVDPGATSTGVPRVALAPERLAAALRERS